MGRYEVKKTIRIKAAPIEVWDALTNPKKTKEYFFHCEVHSGWKPGDTITFKGKMFFIIDITLTGKILEIEPGKLLKYTLKNGDGNDGQEGFSTVTDKLRYEKGETILSITDDVGDGEGAEKRFHKSNEGWDRVLKGLKELVEKDGQQ